MCENGRGHHQRRRRLGDSATLSHEVEVQIANWIRAFAKNHNHTQRKLISGKLLQTKALEFAKEAGVSLGKFRAGSSWRTKFLRRHDLTAAADSQEEKEKEKEKEKERS
jgi:hypothetical protein